jgi:hypothetical protein
LRDVAGIFTLDLHYKDQEKEGQAKDSTESRQKYQAFGLFHSFNSSISAETTLAKKVENTERVSIHGEVEDSDVPIKSQTE